MTTIDDTDLEPAITGRFRALVVLGVIQLVVGIGLGLIWLAWSPHSLAYNIDLGSGHGVIVPGEGESLVAADGRFVVLTAIAGLVFGLLAWRLRHLRGRLTLVTLVVVSLAASVLTKYTGQLLSGGRSNSALNTAFRPHLTLHANAALFVQALLAGLVYTMFVGLTGDPQLGRPEPVPESLPAPTVPAPTVPAPTPTEPEPAAWTPPAPSDQTPPSA